MIAREHIRPNADVAYRPGRRIKLHVLGAVTRMEMPHFVPIQPVQRGEIRARQQKVDRRSRGAPPRGPEETALAWQGFQFQRIDEPGDHRIAFHRAIHNRRRFHGKLPNWVNSQYE